MKKAVLIVGLLFVSELLFASAGPLPRVNKKVLLSCFDQGGTTGARRFKIMDGDKPSQLVAEVTTKDGIKRPAKARFLDYIGSTYESYDQVLARDHEIEVSQNGENLFVTMMRDSVALGAGDLQCLGKGMGLEDQITELCSPRSIVTKAG